MSRASDRAARTWRSSGANRSGTTRSTNPMSMPSSSEAVATTAFKLARLQPPFGRQPLLRGERAVVALDMAFSELLGELMREPLGQPPRVDEDQRGAVLPDQLDQPIVDLVPLFVHADRTEFRPRQLDSQVERSGVADVDDAATRGLSSPPPRPQPGTGPSSRSVFAWPKAQFVANASRTALSSRSSVMARCEPRLSSTIAWISSTMTVSASPRRLATLGGGQHQVERFRRRHQDVRGPSHEAGPLGRSRCPLFAARRELPTRQTPSPVPAGRFPQAGLRGCGACHWRGPAAATRR